MNRAEKYITERGFGDRIIYLTESAATVPMAAAALGCGEREIAKTLSFMLKDGPILIVLAGDAKIDNRKYKDTFAVKAKLLTREEESELIGHPVGGVCPFGVNEGVRVFLDESLRRFEAVYPACGAVDVVMKLALDELCELSGFERWVDVSKLPEVEA